MVKIFYNINEVIIDNMQTFLPYEDFDVTAECLDYKRLGKQRVEAKQILNILLELSHTNRNGNVPWSNHPAVLMWAGYEEALKIYHNSMIAEWIKRGYKNTMILLAPVGEVYYPPWLGDTRFHFSHRSKLLQKNYGYYSRFGWNVEENIDYFWPTKEGYYDRHRAIYISNDSSTDGRARGI